MAEFERTTAARFALRPLEPFLHESGVTEVCVNRPGEAFVEREGGTWERKEVPELTFDALLTLGAAAAVLSDRPWSEADPILSATLPDGERAQFVRPPATLPDRVSVTIRRPSTAIPRLDDYVDSGFFEGSRIGTAAPNPNERELDPLVELRNEAALETGPERDAATAAFLREAVRRKKNIVIAGETGSGKTTFMKALMQEIPTSDRIVTIEDVPELLYGLPNHGNQVNLFYPSEGGGTVTAASLIRSSLRMKPDRILLAELRGAETYDYLTAALSGHGGSITSCHAGSCAEAFEYLALRILQSSAGRGLPYPEIRRLLRLTVDVVVHVHSDHGIRRMTELWYEPEEKDPRAEERRGRSPKGPWRRQ